MEDVVGAIASFGEYIWDSVTDLLKFLGSVIVDAIRWIGSILGKAATWASVRSRETVTRRTASGCTENHNKQEGTPVLATVGVNHGFSLSGLDLIDMNGDHYPDQVSTQGIRYAYFDPATNTGKFCATPAIGAAARRRATRP